jgi:REase_MTES_1575/Transcriptional regulator, AbiEi antitoxin
MAGVGGFQSAIRTKNRPVDLEVGELAQRQHGVVAHRQLTDIGLSPSAIRRRLGLGRLHPVHRGVYAVGHSGLSGHGRWIAAVLACGPSALLSHGTAAALWAIISSSSAQIHVVAARTRNGRRGIVLHRPRYLPEEDRAVVDGIPVTSVARTLVDLAGVLPGQRLKHAVDEAERLQLFDLRAVERVMHRGHARRGLPALRAVLDDYLGPPPLTRSELERRFLELCRDAGLPMPQVNVLVAGIVVDMVWHESRLVVELDGHSYHRTRKAFEDDRIRDATLQAAGYRVIRITHRRLEREPAGVVELLRVLLSPSPERPRGAPRAGARARRAAPVS